MRSRRGDANLWWMVVVAILALFFLGGSTTWAQDVFKGLKATNDDLSCKGLTGQLAGLSGLCFKEKDCENPDEPQAHARQNGEWVYVGDKGCRAKTTTYPYCCVLMPSSGPGTREDRIERSCKLEAEGGQIRKGDIVLKTAVECFPLRQEDSFELADQYTAVRYYLLDGEKATDFTGAKISLVGTDKSAPIKLLIPVAIQSETSYVEFPLPKGPDRLNLKPSFFNVLAVAPESNDLLSVLNDGGTGTISVGRLGDGRITFEELKTSPTLTLPRPPTRICAQGSEGDCANKISGYFQERTIPETGLAVITVCELRRGDVCASRMESRNDVPCELDFGDMTGPWNVPFDDASDECKGVVPSDTCVKQGVRGTSSYLCRIIKIDDKGRGICTEEELIAGDPRLQQHPPCD